MRTLPDALVLVRMELWAGATFYGSPARLRGRGEQLAHERFF
jgi:hypothetical protein